MNVVFLDIDGVLNNYRTTSQSPEGYRGVSTKLVRRLKNIIKSTDSVIVLTSTWKESSDAELAYLYKRLGGMKIVDSTSIVDNRSFLRGTEIRNWLKKHEDVEHFVILDDFDFNYKEEDLIPYLVLTNPENGLTDDDVLEAIEILNGRFLQKTEVVI